MSGLMSVTGFEDRPPARVGPAVADSTAGFFGVIGTILALYHKQRTGEGQFVDISLLEGQLALMGYTIMRQYLGVKVGRTGSQSTGASPAAAYPTSDGKYVYIFAQDSSHFPRLCRLMGKPELAEDPRFNSRPGRTKNREEINELVAQWTRTLTADALEATLSEVRLAYGRVNDVADVMEDPQVQAREMLVEVDHHGKGVLPLVGVLPKLSKTPGSIRMPSPLLGQHNEEIYCGILDVSKEELATLQAEGVI
jgi:crotonobetainyl-CoA:carnitine CoA-transferase CaiB-like acyl-CoA transferase